MKSLSKIDIKQLRILQGLLQEQNLSRVADQLGVTQQAVSDQLKKLRDTLDDRLFVRTSNGVTPTPYAESLRPKVSRILDALEDLLEPETFDPKALTSTFTICSNDLEYVVILPHLINIIRKQAPGLRIEVRKLEIDHLAASLLSGKIDMVITCPDFTPLNCPSIDLYQEQFVCVASEDNVQVRDTMSVEEIARIPQVVVSPSRGDFTGSANRWFETQGFNRNVILSVPTFTAAKACIAESDLCGFIPQQMLPDKGLKEIKLDTTPPDFAVIAAWHQRSSQDPLHTWIREKLLEVSEKLQLPPI